MRTSRWDTWIAFLSLCGTLAAGAFWVTAYGARTVDRISITEQNQAEDHAKLDKVDACLERIDRHLSHIEGKLGIEGDK